MSIFFDFIDIYKQYVYVIDMFSEYVEKTHFYRHIRIKAVPGPPLTLSLDAISLISTAYCY